MMDIQTAFQKALKSFPAATDQICDNVYDAGAAVKLFEGFSHNPPRMTANLKCTAATPTYRVRLVGADDAVLTGNPIVLADTGVSAAMAVGDNVHIEIPVVGQQTAKRFYGIFVTLAGALGTVDGTAVVRQAPQSNMPYQKAAVP